MMLPVARAHPDAFRLLWRHAWHEPEFADQAREFRTYVTFYAGEMLRPYIADPVMLDWAARSAGAHLVEGHLQLARRSGTRTATTSSPACCRPACARSARRGPTGTAGPRDELTQRTAVERVSTMRSICASVATSGGQNVTVSAPIARVITPPASIASLTASSILVRSESGRPHRPLAAGVVDRAVSGERLQSVAEPGTRG